MSVDVWKLFLRGYWRGRRGLGLFTVHGFYRLLHRRARWAYAFEIRSFGDFCILDYIIILLF